MTGRGLSGVRWSDALVRCAVGAWRTCARPVFDDAPQRARPYARAGHRMTHLSQPYCNDPRPRIAMAGNKSVVTDANPGLNRRFSAGDPSEPGRPYDIAARMSASVTSDTGR